MRKFELRVQVDHYYKDYIEASDITDEFGEITDWDKFYQRVWNSFLEQVEDGLIDQRDIEIESWFDDERY